MLPVEALLTTFALGVGSAASPCLLPLYPGFLAYLAGRQDTTVWPKSDDRYEIMKWMSW